MEPKFDVSCLKALMLHSHGQHIINERDYEVCFDPVRVLTISAGSNTVALGCIRRQPRRTAFLIGFSSSGVVRRRQCKHGCCNLDRAFMQDGISAFDYAQDAETDTLLEAAAYRYGEKSRKHAL